MQSESGTIAKVRSLSSKVGCHGGEYQKQFINHTYADASRRRLSTRWMLAQWRHPSAAPREARHGSPAMGDRLRDPPCPQASRRVARTLAATLPLAAKRTGKAARRVLARAAERPHAGEGAQLCLGRWPRPARDGPAGPEPPPPRCSRLTALGTRRGVGGRADVWVGSSWTPGASRDGGATVTRRFRRLGTPPGVLRCSRRKPPSRDAQTIPRRCGTVAGRPGRRRTPRGRRV